RMRTLPSGDTSDLHSGPWQSVVVKPFSHMAGRVFSSSAPLRPGLYVAIAAPLPRPRHRARRAGTPPGGRRPGQAGPHAAGWRRGLAVAADRRAAVAATAR